MNEAEYNHRMCGWDPSTGDPTEAKRAELEVKEYVENRVVRAAIP